MTIKSISYDAIAIAIVGPGEVLIRTLGSSLPNHDSTPRALTTIQRSQSRGPASESPMLSQSDSVLVPCWDRVMFWRPILLFLDHTIHKSYMDRQLRWTFNILLLPVRSVYMYG